MEIEKHSSVRMLFIADGDPRDPRTNSGVSSRLIAALPPSLELADALSSTPSKATSYYERVKTFVPNRTAWRSRWRLSMGHVRAAAAATQKHFEDRDPGGFDAVLQLGTHCKTSAFAPKPVFVYIDHTLAAMIELDPRMRGTSPDAPYVRRRLAHERDVLRTCAGVFTFSEWCKRRVVADYGVDESRVACVGAGSNLDDASIQDEPAYAAQHAVFVGLDFERKGGPTVLDAFARVRERLPRARLTIVGGLPPGRPAPGVTSTGPLTGPTAKREIAAILASASLYVMPSVFEPFGIALLEAMARGLPCIASDICAMPEIVGDAGSTVTPGDGAGLAREMLGFLNEPDRCREVGRIARQRYTERFGWHLAASNIRREMAAALTRG